jgi:hypothetical protein
VQSLPVTFRTRPLKMIFLVLGSGLFVMAGIWLFPREPFIGGITIIFFGLCAVVGVIGLHPKSSFLTLTTEGFLFASLFRRHFVPWSSVQSFVTIQIGLNKMVGWQYMPEFQVSIKIRQVNTAISGAEAALPDTYGMSAEELCTLLSQLHRQYGQRAL